MKTGRAKTIVALLLAAVFGAGLLGGTAVARATESRAPAAPRECDRDRDGRKGHTSMLDSLDLSAAQRAAVDSVLEQRRGQIDRFWEGEGARLRALVDSTRAEVRAILTPAQRARYDEMRARKHARRGEHGHDRDRRDDGGPRGAADEKTTEE